MKLCNARIDFKISLGLLSWFIITRKIAFWSVLALQIVDPIFLLFFCNVCPQGGVDLYGDGDMTLARRGFVIVGFIFAIITLTQGF